MAEICLDCYNKIFDKELNEQNAKLLDDFCEECGEWKPTIVRIYDKKWWEFWK